MEPNEVGLSTFKKHERDGRSKKDKFLMETSLDYYQRFSIEMSRSQCVDHAGKEDLTV